MAAGNDSRSVAQLNQETTINGFTGNDLPEINDHRAMDAAKVLWIQAPLKFIQGNLHQI